jgi:hypothetical protein
LKRKEHEKYKAKENFEHPDIFKVQKMLLSRSNCAKTSQIFLNNLIVLISLELLFPFVAGLVKDTAIYSDKEKSALAKVRNLTFKNFNLHF